MAGMNIGAGIAGLAIAFSYFSADREAPAPDLVVRKRYLWISTALAAACVLSLVSAKFFPLVYGGHLSEVGVFQDSIKIWYLFWPLVLFYGIKELTLEWRKRVLSAYFIAFGLLSILAIVQFYTGWPRPQPIPQVDGRYHATLFFGHHLSTASILIFPFFMCLGFALKPELWGKRAPWIALSALGFIALMLTFSRTLWVSLPIGIVAWMFFLLGRRAKIGAAIGILLVGGVLALQPAVQVRLMNRAGIMEREDLWRANWEFFKARPLTGAGWRHNIEISGYYLMDKYKSNDVFSGHAHNNLIDILGGTGGLGAIAFLLWCVFTFWITFDGARKSKGHFAVLSGLAAAWLVFHLNGLTQVNIWDAKVQHQLAWALAWIFFWRSDREQA
jgi:O-antigen ligase